MMKQFFEQYHHMLVSAINTAMPCKVISFDAATCTAKIKPLIRIEDEGTYIEREVLENVPVLKQKVKIDGVTKELTPALEKGDVVQVIFNQSSIDKAQNGLLDNPSARKFSVMDAVIVGVF